MWGYSLFLSGSNGYFPAGCFYEQPRSVIPERRPLSLFPPVSETLDGEVEAHATYPSYLSVTWRILSLIRHLGFPLCDHRFLPFWYQEHQTRATMNIFKKKTSAKGQHSSGGLLFCFPLRSVFQIVGCLDVLLFFIEFAFTEAWKFRGGDRGSYQFLYAFKAHG